MVRQERHRTMKLIAGIATGMLLVGAASAYAGPSYAAADIAVGAADRVAVSGPRLAYADMTESAGWDVFIRDDVARTTHVVGGAGDQLSADIDGTIAVYVDFSRGDSDIKGYDVVERRAFEICIDPGNQTRPRIHGDWVVWSELGVGSTGAVHALNLVTSEQIVIADSLAANAELSGTSVVFEDHSEGSAINVFDLAEKTVRTVAPADSDAIMPATDGEWVTWVVPGVDGYDIAYQRIGASAPIVMKRAGEQSMPSISNGTLSFSERVAGSPVGIVRVELETGDTEAVEAESDIIGFDADEDASALLSSAGIDRWAVDAELANVSLVDRARAAVAAVWRRVAPVRYLAWASDSPTFSASGAEQAAALLEPGSVNVVVSGPTSVTVSWSSPRSLRGVKDYDVYRSLRPIDAGSLKRATKVASAITSTTFVDKVTATPENPAKASAYYYAVIARDQRGELSPLSLSVSADPHGAGMYTVSGVDQCATCHSVHRSSDSTAGALGALSADRCYDCHGSTAKTVTRGAGSFFDTQAGFRDDTTNTPGPALANGGSIHRNATMVQRQRECTSCHDAHTRPFAVDEKGAYDASASSAKMLRAQVGTGKENTWSDSDPAGNRICFACHGSTMTPITIVGGSAAYARSGGDHAGSGDRTYAGSAHASLGTTGSAAAVQCLVCHNQHGSATARLVDYRQSGTTDANANKQGNLCYRCHNAATPNTWNGRDVRAEFTRASRHPSLATTATGTASATCVSCHNSHFAQKGSGVWDASRVSDPLNTSAGVSSTTGFCLRCHSQASGDGAIAINAATATNKLVPYEIRMRPSGLWSYFTGWGKADQGTEFVNSGHATASVSKGRAGCETCHDPHASDFAALTAWTRPAGAVISGGLTGERANSAVFADRSKEENLCYQCHGNGTAGTGKAIGAADIYSPAQSAYAHPVAKTDAHKNSESAADLASSRHAECVDCHDPHAARPGVHKANSSVAGESLRGAVGVKPTWSGDNWSDVTIAGTTRIVPGAGDDYEAYLCFKCHSAPTKVGTSGSAGFSTNIAREFNPRNFSYHRVLGDLQSGVRDVFSVTPVGGAKTNVTWTFPKANVFKSGYDSDTMMTCSSCHGGSVAGEARGPHGSSSKYMLDPAYPVDWNSTGATLTQDSPGMPDDLVCSKCHSLTDGNGAWSNNVHKEHAEKGGTAAYCRNCHVGVPHGWKRPRLLGYTTDEFPYNTWKNSTGTASSGDWGLTRVKVKATTSPQGWTASDCYAGCHSEHGSAVRSYWP